MFKKMLSALRGQLAHRSAAELASSSPGMPAADETAAIFESLAMTDELRDALFPKTPRMVSAIFDRPAPLVRPTQSPSGPSQSSGGNAFPIIF